VTNPTVEYHNLSPPAKHEVFQHVQLGVSLMTAEKLQAISSPWANYIMHLEKTHLMIDGGLVNHIAFDDTHRHCCDSLP
jgi:hypothetical protein